MQLFELNSFRLNECIYLYNNNILIQVISSIAEIYNNFKNIANLAFRLSLNCFPLILFPRALSASDKFVFSKNYVYKNEFVTSEVLIFINFI